jgi:hypothetical protein
LFLSPVATLPIALTAAESVYMGGIALLSSTLILLLISPQEAAIVLFATGALGFALGISSKKKTVLSIGISAITLFIGIHILIYIIGLNAFGDMTPRSAPVWGAVSILLFSVFYAGIWRVLLKFFLRHIKSQPRQRNMSSEKGMDSNIETMKEGVNIWDRTNPPT